MKNLRSIISSFGMALAFFSAIEVRAQFQFRPAWDGIGNANPGTTHSSRFVPPDPHGAVGPQGVLATVNGCIAYYDKSGSLIWGPSNIVSFLHSYPSFRNADPKAIYDRNSGRFIVIMQVNTELSFVFFAVSKNSHPMTGGFSDWVFPGPANMTLFADEEYGGDYPGLAVDDKALYLTYNMFSLAAGGELDEFKGAQILIFDKVSLFSGFPGNFGQIFVDGQTLQPANPIGPGSPGNRMFFAEVFKDGGTRVRLWTLDDPLGAHSIHSEELVVPVFGQSSGGAPQLGTSIKVDTLGTRAMSALWLNGDVWFCHTAGGGSGHSIVYWYRVRPQAGGAALVEAGNFDGGPGVWFYLPSIGANYRSDIALVFTRSSEFTYPRMYYAVRSAANSVFGPPLEAKQSAGFNNSSRWGDYAVVCADPANDTLWMAHEYARSSSANDWGTWWVNLQVLHGDFYVNRNYAGMTENGTQANPFKTLTSAYIGSVGGENIRIFAGNYNERLTINKNVTLTADPGPVTIGSP